MGNVLSKTMFDFCLYHATFDGLFQAIKTDLRSIAKCSDSIKPNLYHCTTLRLLCHSNASKLPWLHSKC